MARRTTTTTTKTRRISEAEQKKRRVFVSGVGLVSPVTAERLKRERATATTTTPSPSRARAESQTQRARELQRVERQRREAKGTFVAGRGFDTTEQPIQVPQGGLSDRERAELAGGRAGARGELGTPVLDPITGEITPSPEEQRRREQEAGRVFLEEQGFFDLTRPERVELDIEREGFPEELPVLGPLAIASSNIFRTSENLYNIFLKGIIGLDFSDVKKEDIDNLLSDPETARAVSLQAIQQAELEKGTSESEKFGALVESIPVAGPLASKYAGAMLETPAQNVVTILKQLKTDRTRTLQIQQRVKSGEITPQQAWEIILDIEEDTFEGEQRVHQLSSESAVLIADGDTLNLIESKFLQNKEAIFLTKNTIANEFIGEATRVQGMSDSQIAMELNQLTAEEGGVDEEREIVFG